MFTRKSKEWCTETVSHLVSILHESGYRTPKTVGARKGLIEICKGFTCAGS